MKITYKFADGTVSEVEVSEEIGIIIMESRKKELNLSRKERYHCISLDAFEYEGEEVSCPDFTEKLSCCDEEKSDRVRKAFSHLSEIQQRRLSMLAEGLSVREIARREGKNFRSVYESIESAKKKFLKFF